MGLLEYSAITTKIRAMSSSLFTEEDYRHLSSLESIPEFVDYLRRSRGYNDTYSNLDTEDLHRGYLEKLLTKDRYDDFARIYRFANVRQRRYMDLYFMRIEVSFIKTCHRMLFDGQKINFILEEFGSFFDKHSDVNLHALSSVSSLGELHEALRGSKYYEPLKKLQDFPAPTLFDYETRLDLFYFTTLWKNRTKCLKGRDLEIITEVYGTRIDMVNMQWIYRTKKYHDLSPAQIYSFIIPFTYKLKSSELSALVEAGSVEEFISVYKTTFYKDYDFNEQVSLENIHQHIQLRLARASTRKYPYSIASINSYLYNKEIEVRRLVRALECIRYKLNPAESYKIIMR